MTSVFALTEENKIKRGEKLSQSRRANKGKYKCARRQKHLKKERKGRKRERVC